MYDTSRVNQRIYRSDKNFRWSSGILLILLTVAATCARVAPSAQQQIPGGLQRVRRVSSTTHDTGL